MKKLFIAAIAALTLSTGLFAQEKQATPPAKKEKQTVKKTKLTKKDGTADMRFKANKDSANMKKVPLKKDGTPDKRFKENKKS